MPIIISIVIFLILTMQTFFLGGTVWLGIVGMLLSAAGVVLSFVLKNRKKYLSNVSALAGIVISVVCCLFITSGSGTGTLRQKRYFSGKWSVPKHRRTSKKNMLIMSKLTARTILPHSVLHNTICERKKQIRAGRCFLSSRIQQA